MRHLYDFGISQEDPLTELKVLDIRDHDRLLCVSSGGEVPLTLLSLHDGIQITAVDISCTQLALSRLKLQAALTLPFPLNGRFLGYAHAKPKVRREIYFDLIHHELIKGDQDFWLQHLSAIDHGVVHSGRFEEYIKQLRKIMSFMIGHRNLLRLLACKDTANKNMFLINTLAAERQLIIYSGLHFIQWCIKTGD